MKTIFHTNIDGFEVVLGFGEAFGLVDPIATSTKIAPLLLDSPEQQQVAAQSQAIQQRRMEAGQIAVQAKAAFAAGDPAAVQRLNAQYALALADVADMEAALVPLVQAFQAARSKLWEANASYFSPPPGETLIPDDQASTLQMAFASKAPAQQLCMDGTLVGDFRGKIYWTPGARWTKTVVTKLGDGAPAGGIEESALTGDQATAIAAQVEADRVAALTPGEIATEAANAKAGALAQAAQMKTELDIAGDAQALAKSQAAYQAAITDIDAKYGS